MQPRFVGVADAKAMARTDCPAGAGMIAAKSMAGSWGEIPNRHGAANTRHAPGEANPASADDAFLALAGLFLAHAAFPDCVNYLERIAKRGQPGR